MTSPCCAVQAWSTCWDPKYEILFSDDWADAFYHANINYLDATCVQFTELCVCVLWLSACSRLMLSRGRALSLVKITPHIVSRSSLLCCVVLSWPLCMPSGAATAKACMVLTACLAASTKPRPCSPTCCTPHHEAWLALWL